MLLPKISDKENFSSKEMHALCHESCVGPEVCEGIASDAMCEDDFDKWFRHERHKLKLLCPPRLVSWNVGGLYTKATVYFVGLCRHHWNEP